MKSLNSLIDELRATDWDARDAVRTFEAEVLTITALGTPEVIGPLLSLLDDEAPFHEPMFTIIHGVESFDDGVYVEHVLRATPALCDRAPNWAAVVLIRILNSQPARLEIIRQLQRAPGTTKPVVKALMERIGTKDQRLAPLAAAVTVAAS